MASFANAMNASATTWNGAVSLASPDASGEASGRLGLFFKSVRGLSIPALYKLLSKSASENVVDAFVIAFHIRDCRDGKGERELGRRALAWLLINYPQEFTKVYTMIPEFGRWDDMLQLFPRVLELSNIEYVRANYSSPVKDESQLQKARKVQELVVSEFAAKLLADKLLMEDGKPCSLAAKWAPTEKDSLDRKTGVVATLARSMKLHPQAYRKTVTTPLRSYLNVVEKYMVENRWSEIDYSKVPSCAIKRLKKAFEKHSPEAFAEWRAKLSTGETTVKATQLFPYELVKEMEQKGLADPICEAQWKVIISKVKEMGIMKDTIAVVDTSGSMRGLPMQVAISIGLILLETVEGEFANHLLTFHDSPSFAVIKGETLYERYKQIANMGWGGSTDLIATFQLILKRGKACNIPQDKMPKKLMIISDMQLNQADRNPDRTNFETIDQMYKDSGYVRPQIVFWNVNGGSLDYPVSVDENGTALISGASPAVMKQVMESCDFSPASILYDLTHSERYANVRAALEPANQVLG
jgi:hypothetical protein